MTKTFALLLFLFSVPVQAVELEFALGYTQFHRIHRDNYWYQEPFPYEHDLTSEAFRLGVRKRYGDWTYGLAYLQLGTAKVNATVIPSDEAYGRCVAGDKSSNGCAYPTTKLWVEDKVRGLELSAARSFDQFYARGGLMLWHHYLRFGTDYGEGPAQIDVLLAPFLGVGVEYKPLFLEVNYYHVLGDGAFPIAKKATTFMAGIRIRI